jgi:hypothetical protein
MKYRVTANMFRTVFAEVMLNIPLSSHTQIVQLISMAQGNMGFHHYEQTSATRMARFISDDMHKKLIVHLKTEEPSPCAIIVDGSTDPQQNHYLIVYIQALEGLTPVVYFYRLLGVGNDETAAGLLTILQNSFEEDGLTAAIKQNLVSFAADGAAVMMGKKMDWEKNYPIL